ncbi:MAG: exonuclease SbcCD subunit D, partial [Chloroflexi bacterium]|nr:exonuclease SbcCD subunit D [Chloroflexota bacterium]
MRILHTADWHIGRTIRGRSRVAEFEAVLAEVVEIARRERVEAVLVCGDIWDHHAPTAESDRLVFEALRECIGHGIQVVLIAGNHDNPSKLRALGLLSELLGVQTQSDVLRPNAGGVLTIEGREHIARIAAVPFITEGRYVDAAGVMGLQEDWFGVYADGVAGVLRAICEGFDADSVNLLATHVFVDHARIASIDGSERRLQIGQTYAVAAASLPVAPQYIALGHVHEPQEILGAPVPTAYSGSLLQLDFGERDQQKVVRIVDLEVGRPARHSAVPLTSGRRLAEVRGTFDEVVAQGAGLGDAYLRAVVRVEQPTPGLAQRLREVLPNCVDVRVESAHPDAELEPVEISRLS